MKRDIVWGKWKSKESNFQRIANIPSNKVYGEHLAEEPSSSIMILTYKRADLLQRALDSALNQDFSKPYEIVVVDDCVFDQATDDLMRQYCNDYENVIYYRNQENLGQYANWNRACELCRSDWYCLLHNDDMVKPNYLSELASLESDEIGVIGSFFDVLDERATVIEKKRVLDRFIDLFLALSNGKLLELTLKDNIKHIFTFSCCLYINKSKYMDIGGLDDEYYPSSDFFFSSKMNYYYKTAFYTKRMSIRTISNNESLKQSVCNDSIVCAYNHTYHMCKDLNYAEKKSRKHASLAAISSEIGVKGYNDIDYGPLKKELGLKDTYNKPFIISMINLYSKFNWGKLLFRKGFRPSN